jgi:hypothetical protein
VLHLSFVAQIEVLCGALRLLAALSFCLPCSCSPQMISVTYNADAGLLFLWLMCLTFLVFMWTAYHASHNSMKRLISCAIRNQLHRILYTVNVGRSVSFKVCFEIGIVVHRCSTRCIKATGALKIYV